MSRGRAGRVSRPLLALGALLAAGCAQPLYVLRLGWEQARLLARRQPIGELLARPDLEPGVRERLELVLSARRFARDALGLRVDGVFATVVAIDRRAVVHTVSAAYRDRLEAYTWWYPVVGRVPYRGFFDESAARSAAQRLTERGFDVDVRPAVAFSTLGYFADPLPSTLLGAGPVPLVETVLHELFHATLWVAGEVRFNESAATFVGHRGAVAYFCAGPRPDPERCAEARARWDGTRREGRILERLAGRLERLYAAGLDPAVREARRRGLHRRAVRALEARGLARRAGDLWPPNNARLLAALLYATRLDRFEALASGEGGVAGAIARLRDGLGRTGGGFAALEALAGEGVSSAGSRW